MKILTSGAVFTGVARRVAVNMLWITAFVAVPVLLAQHLTWPVVFAAALGVVLVVYVLVLAGTIVIAKRALAKDEGAFMASPDDAKAEQIVRCSWWGG